MSRISRLFPSLPCALTIHHQDVFQLERKKQQQHQLKKMRVFQLLAPLLLVGFDVADADDKYLMAGERLSPGETITTTSPCTGRKLWLTFQTDGDLVFYKYNYDGEVEVIWSSNTYIHYSYDVDAAVMQTDGNFVVYKKGGVAQWASGTYPNTDGESNYLTMHDDGTLSVGSSSHPKKWTAGRACYIPSFPGCYYGRLEHYSHDIVSGDRNDVCLSTCVAKGYVYAGLHAGTHCDCGNYPISNRDSDESCFDFFCPDRETGNPCGGDDFSSVGTFVSGLALSTSKTKED